MGFKIYVFPQDSMLILFCVIVAFTIGVDIQYFKDLAEYREKRAVFDRLETSQHVGRLFLHDIRHIVASFKLYLHHFKKGKLKDPEEQYKRLLKRFDRCEEFLKDVLAPEFSDYLLEETDIVSFVDKTVDDFASLRNPGIKIIKKYPDKPVKINLDKNKFEKVIFVILNNAYEAMNGKGELDVSIDSFDNTLELKINDSGSGMTEGMMEKLGMPGFSTKGEKGQGLGIYTSVAVIQRHDGTLKIDSRKDEGSTFIIELPL